MSFGRHALGLGMAWVLFVGCGEQEVVLFGSDGAMGDGAVEDGTVTEGGVAPISDRDPESCGPAAVHCEDDEYCIDGVCGCRQGLVLGEESECVDPAADGDSCGSTAVDCPGVCADGTCVASCPAGTTQCEDGCVDVASHPLHCGECGRPCGAASVCVEGLCAPFRPAECDSCPCDGCETGLCCTYPSTTDPICVEAATCPVDF